MPAVQRISAIRDKFATKVEFHNYFFLKKLSPVIKSCLDPIFLISIFPERTCYHHGVGRCSFLGSRILVELQDVVDANFVRTAMKDIVETAIAAGTFKTLAAALGAAGLVETLKGAGPFTVFAPSDAAFAKLPAGTVDGLVAPAAKAKLTGILTYHVVAGKVLAADVMKLQNAKTVNGQSVAVKVVDGKVMIDTATVVTADIECTNGVIHVIDSVLMPK